MMPDQSTRRTVRLPYDFGTVVYVRTRTDRVPGMVTGYTVRPNGLVINVTWGDQCGDSDHYFFELSTDYTPFSEA